ncbi:MAG: dihydrofolate reductase [Gallionella sp.]
MNSPCIIVAMAKNRTIGIHNTLPWHCPEDLKHFKLLTLGNHIIMGRKTFESIGKPLPRRTTVVLTRDLDLKIEGCLMAHSLTEALTASDHSAQICIVGGAQIYAQAMPKVKTLYVTEIQQEIAGDAHFPEIDRHIWLETSREIRRQTLPQPLAYHFVTYQRQAL